MGGAVKPPSITSNVQAAAPRILPWLLLTWLYESGLANFRQHQIARKKPIL
jgi:hypothetical protein